jgi:hypothetical protein
MRQLLSFLLLFCIESSYGQEIELQGRYGASFIGGESIEFVGKDSFYFSGFYCTNGVHGKGRCEIRNNYLFLYFEKNKNKSKLDFLRPAIIERTITTDSSSAIHITTVDNSDIPIPYAMVEIGSGKAVRIKTSTDTSGQAIIKVNNDSFPLTVRTSAVGIEPGQLILDSSSNYTIKLFHLQNDFIDKKLNNGEVFVYEIDELSEDLILMRPQRSSERFRQYHKKKD